MPPEPQLSSWEFEVFQELQITFITCTKAHQNPIFPLQHPLSMCPKPVVPTTCTDLPSPTPTFAHSHFRAFAPTVPTSTTCKAAPSDHYHLQGFAPRKSLMTTPTLVTLITSLCFNCFTGSS